MTEESSKDTLCKAMGENKNCTELIQVNLGQIFKNKAFYMDTRIEVFIEILSWAFCFTKFK